MSSTPHKILVIHGPNLNLLGSREPAIYGHTTLADIDQQLAVDGQALGAVVHSFQSNHEGAIVDKIHESVSNSVQFIIINAGAYTHTSIAIRDALAGTAIPFVEVHLSNVYAREPFRHQSYLSALAKGVICGLGSEGYRYALQFAVKTLNQPT